MKRHRWRAILEHDMGFERLGVDGADEFPGVVEVDTVVVFFDADDLSCDSASGEDAKLFPTDVTGGGNFSQQGPGGIRHLRKGSRPRA